MEAFTTHTGKAILLNRSNVDTDAIIPKQFLRRIERSGFGKFLFFDWRYIDGDITKPDPAFVLNKAENKGATILVARDNFGCGSSREHAPWALTDYGFRAIIAPSFAEIFYNNCFNNGLLPVVLKAEEVQQIFDSFNKQTENAITIDLNKQTVAFSSGTCFRFEINPFSKDCMLKGLDSIAWTLQHKNAISAYEEKKKKERPWLN